MVSSRIGRGIGLAAVTIAVLGASVAITQADGTTGAAAAAGPTDPLTRLTQKVDSLQKQVSTLQTRIKTMQNRINTLQKQLKQFKTWPRPLLPFAPPLPRVLIPMHPPKAVPLIPHQSMPPSQQWGNRGFPNQRYYINPVKPQERGRSFGHLLGNDRIDSSPEQLHLRDSTGGSQDQSNSSPRNVEPR